MAKLGLAKPFCPHAFEIETLLGDEQRQEAIKYAIAQLRRGVSTRRFLEAVADLLEPPPIRKRGRPKVGGKSQPTESGTKARAKPKLWHKIGPEFELLVYEGMSYELAVETMAKKFGQSDSSIERAVRYYREAAEIDRQ